MSTQPAPVIQDTQVFRLATTYDEDALIHMGDEQ
jgi:hypothetical protein